MANSPAKWRLHNQIAAPLIITPDMSEQDIQKEALLMQLRSKAADCFIKGLISWEDYLDLLEEHGIDPELFHDNIENRILEL